MYHDPIAGHPLRGMDGGHPWGPDRTVGDVFHGEGLPLAALHADHDKPLLDVYREHLGGAPLKALGGIVVASELDAVAGAAFLIDFDEGAGLGAAWTKDQIYDRKGKRVADSGGLNRIARISRWHCMAVGNPVRNRIVKGLAGLHALTATTSALAQDGFADPAGSGPIVAGLRWMQDTLLGTVATVVAVIAIASVGFLMLTGRINWRYGAVVILGCFILFGAASIVGGIQSTAGLGG